MVELKEAPAADATAPAAGRSPAPGQDRCERGEVTHLVYIAGPFTKPCPLRNTRVAMDVFEELRQWGRVTPICPHWSLLQQMHTPLTHRQWLDHDFEIIRRCDAVLRLPGESDGADQEVELANELGIPVFRSQVDLYRFTEENRPGARTR